MWQVRRDPLVFGALAFVAISATIGCAAWAVVNFYDATIVTARNFYGVLRVQETGVNEVNRHRTLVHGTIMHGTAIPRAAVSPPGRRATTRRLRASAGCWIRCIRARSRCGSASSASAPERSRRTERPGDLYRFYDINPDVIAIAKRDFTYLSDSEATIETPLGDARLTLEREPPAEFDVLVIDAFSSDAIPVHLITSEALAVVREAHEARRRHRIPRHQPLSRSRPGGQGARRRAWHAGGLDSRRSRGRAGKPQRLGARVEQSHIARRSPESPERRARSSRGPTGGCGPTTSTTSSRSCAG